MLKNTLILWAFLMLLGGAAAASAQEIKESNLTPRQLLLLHVPDDYELDAGNGVSWGVVHDTQYGPLEYVAKVIGRPVENPDTVFIQIAHMLGGKMYSLSLQLVIPFPTMGFSAELNPEEELEITFLDPALGITEEIAGQFMTKQHAHAVETMKTLKVFEDQDLVEHIKKIKKNDSAKTML